MYIPYRVTVYYNYRYFVYEAGNNGSIENDRHYNLHYTNTHAHTHTHTYIDAHIDDVA